MKKLTQFILTAFCLTILLFGTGFAQDKDAKKAPAPKDPKAQAESLVERALKLLEKGEEDKAFPLLDKAIQTYAANEEAWIIKSKVYIMKDKTDLAVASLKKAVTQNPKSANLWFHYGVAMGKSGQYGYSLTCFDNAMKFNQNLADAWKFKGYSLAKLYRFKEAVPVLEQALTMKPDDNHTKLILGISLYHVGQTEKGKSMIQESLKGDPNLKKDIPKSMTESMGI